MDRLLNKEERIVLGNKESKRGSQPPEGVGQAWETTKCRLAMKNILDPLS